MAMSEFDIIRRNFAGRGVDRGDVVLGIGDDGAVVRVPSNCDLVTVVDTLVAGVHFPHETRPEDVGHKALAVNLSDVAAMGAVPAWATLALTMPHADEAWLSAFARGFFGLAQQYEVQLIGGDTTHGPLTVTVQIQGWVRTGQAVRRSGARPGDIIYVTGSVGDAGLALRAWQQQQDLTAVDGEYLFSRLHRPIPRCKEGEVLSDVVTAMVDVSDGLAADLGHILDASGVGATLNLESIPLSPSFFAVTGSGEYYLNEAERLRLALSAGDDYELCFTAPTVEGRRVEKLFSDFSCGCHAIGIIEAAQGLRLRQADGTLLSLEHSGYEHFSQEPDA
jgi:thiamine-monophosphate kinase